MAKYKGIGASNGIEISKVFKLDEVKFDIKKTISTDYKKEIDKLNNANKHAHDDIKKLEKITATKLGAEKAAIFQAHQQILADPTINDEIIKIIKEEKLEAAYAVEQVKNKYVNIFKNMTEVYFKERAADVNDVYSRVLKYILKLPVIDLATINSEVIIVATDLTPSETAQLNPKFVKGFVCDIGGRTSHAAIMARSLEIPAVLGLKNITAKTKNNEKIIIDGNLGEVIVNPTQSEEQMYIKSKLQLQKEINELQSFKNKQTISKDGKKFIIEGNIGSVSDVSSVINNGGEGVGLFRSEFLYMDNSNFPTEEEQFKAYKEVLQKMNNKIVIIRTLDIGGDKSLSYFEFPKEMNPFLGYRAIRLCLDKLDIFKTQLRALLRASAYGNLAIMFPMVATIDEFKKAKKITLEEKDKLIKKGIKVAKNIQIGLMIEVPTAAVIADKFAKYADFFSIGTNDLIQYSFAADRMSEHVSYLYQPYNPATLKLIKMTIDGAHANNKWVGMCGEVAGDEKAIPLLIGLGLDSFSMSATSMLKARKIISCLDTNEMANLVNEALELETNEEVLNLVNKKVKF